MEGEKLEEIKCSLCGSNKTKSAGFINLSEAQQDIFSVKKLTVVQCRKCGLIYTNPQPSKDVLKEFYDIKYNGANIRSIEEILANKSSMLCAGAYVTYDLRFCKWLLHEINHLSKRKGKMLDIGCGQGRFIKFAKDNGWKVFGQEFSDEAAKYAKDKFGLKVQEGGLIDLNFPNDYFDAVIMLNVIEHFTNPILYLNEAHKILKGGITLFKHSKCNFSE